MYYAIFHPINKSPLILKVLHKVWYNTILAHNQVMVKKERGIKRKIIVSKGMVKNRKGIMNGKIIYYKKERSWVHMKNRNGF